jgi:hypothetical protein
MNISPLFKSDPNIQVDDIVIVVDDQVPRNWWPLGRVVEVMKDSKGFVRRARVKTKTSIVDRPISKLCVLVTSE